MLSLSFLFWATLVIALISFWWHSDKIKSDALAHVYRHCKSQNLQLLDQNMVLIGVWPIRDEAGTLQIRRRYRFEFSSTGKARYQGNVELLGRRLQSMQLEAHIMPQDEDSIL